MSYCIFTVHGVSIVYGHTAAMYIESRHILVYIYVIPSPPKAP